MLTISSKVPSIGFSCLGGVVKGLAIGIAGGTSGGAAKTALGKISWIRIRLTMRPCNARRTNGLGGGVRGHMIAPIGDYGGLTIGQR